MFDLSDTKAINKLDPQNTLKSTDMLLEQCQTAWKEVQVLNLPKDAKNISNVVFCGMGASIYGAMVLKGILGPKMSFPTETVSDYFLPDYVNSNSLVVLTSYSGSTEEVLSCAQDAKARNAKMLVLTRGGKLADFTKENNIPAYVFDGRFNPSRVPRLGTGYSIFGLLGLLEKIGIFTFNNSDIESSFDKTREKIKEIKTKAMRHSQELVGKIPIVFAAEHLSGNAQILRNQFNETSKTFSAHFLIPDLNHHLMEGLQFPEKAPLHFIILNSSNYSAKIKKRVDLTVDVVEKNNYNVSNIMNNASNIYGDFLETIIYGSYLTLYLGLLHKQNPAVNPWVDYFKEELAK